MRLKRFEFEEVVEEGTPHPVEAAIQGLKKVRSNWLRDPDVVAVDVGYYLQHGHPVGPMVYLYREVERNDDGEVVKQGERLCSQQLADKLGISLAEAEQSARVKHLGLPNDLECFEYTFPWIRVHVNRKLTPDEVLNQKKKPYQKYPIAENGRTFEVHVVQALYSPAQHPHVPDLDTAIDDFWNELTRQIPGGGNFERGGGGEAAPTELGRTLSRLENALDRRYTSPYLEGSAVETREVVDPLTGGISVGNTRHQLGTLGAVVWDKTDCKPCILSCWHVLDGGRVQIGEPCLQPAMRDGGTVGAHTVARLKRSKVGFYVDAALAELQGLRSFSAGTILCGPDQCNSVNVAGISHASHHQLLGENVWKCGRSSRITEGIIDGVELSLSIEYIDGTSENFNDQLHIVPDWPDSGEVEPGSLQEAEVSRAGDSGAIWLDNEMMAVGLNFAGDTTNSPLGDFAIANRMVNVERELDISFTPVFSHPREMTDRQRGSGALGSSVTAQSTRDFLQNLAEVLSRASRQLNAAFGPIGQPETRPPGGGSDPGAIGLPQTWPPGGGSGAGAEGQPQTRPPGGGRRG